jgi:hypothetical protein
MENRNKGKQCTNPEAGPSLGSPITLYTTPTQCSNRSPGVHSVTSERSYIVEILEALAELVVEPMKPADVQECDPLNKGNELDNGGAPQPWHPPQLLLNPDLVMLQTIEMMAHNLKQLNANAASQDSARAKVQEPDPFLGQDPQKLWMFLMQCRLQF